MTQLPFLPGGATAQAALLHHVWAVFFWTGIVVFVIVGGLIAGSIVRWRRREDALPVQFRRNARLEAIMTLIPLAVVGLLFVLTYRIEVAVETLSPMPAATVSVTGFRWSWRFRYVGRNVEIVGTPRDPPQMVIPVDVTTRVTLDSIDVNHGFWVPDFLFKRDAIPGVANAFDWHPQRTGTYQGRCAEFCGLAHAGMTFSVRVVTHTEFDAWLRRHATPTTALRASR